jgi:beta-D-xylosidase 4
MMHPLGRTLLAFAVLTWHSALVLAQDSKFVCTGVNEENNYNATVSYLGCYTDAVERTLDGKQTNIARNDAKSCANFCGYLGYKYSAMEYTT